MSTITFCLPPGVRLNVACAPIARRHCQKNTRGIVRILNDNLECIIG
jgi:hypothetical protein